MAVRGRPFEPGNPGGPGGARDGAGRPPNEFRTWLGDVLHSKKARQRYEKIINDESDADEKVTEQGVAVPTRAKAQTYLQALELGWNYDQGKPNQPLSGADGGPLGSFPASDLITALDLLRQRADKDIRSGAGEEEKQ